MKSITLTTHLFTQYLHLAFRKLLALHQTCYPSIKFFQRRSIFWHISVLLYCCTCNYNEINKMLQLTFKMSNFKLNSGLSQIKCKKIQKIEADSHRISHVYENNYLAVRLGLCESSFLLLEYSVEYLIEYSSTRWIPEVAINHRVFQTKRIPGSSFKFVV